MSENSPFHKEAFIKILISMISLLVAWETKGGAVVRALASNQCGSGSIPELGIIC